MDVKGKIPGGCWYQTHELSIAFATHSVFWLYINPDFDVLITLIFSYGFIRNIAKLTKLHQYADESIQVFRKIEAKLSESATAHLNNTGIFN